MPNVAEVLQDHVTLTVDCVDRLYLNASVPRLQSSGGVVGFLEHRGQIIPSPALFGKLTTAFVAALRAWCQQEEIPWLSACKELWHARIGISNLEIGMPDLRLPA